MPVSNMRQRLIAYQMSRFDRDVLAPAAHPYEIVAAEVKEDVGAVLDTQPVVGLVWELRSSTADELHRIVSLTHARSIPLLLRVELSTASARELLKIGSHVRDIHISLKGFDDLANDVRRLLQVASFRPAVLVILETIADRPLTPGTEALIASILVGRRRTTVCRFAEVLKMPVRTLESRLRSERLPTARELLGWAVSLHLLWRIECLSVSLKSAAALSGFRSSEAASNYVARNVGMRPEYLRQRGGFPLLLGRFRERLGP